MMGEAVKYLAADTLQEFLERGEKSGVIDFSLRILRNPEGDLDFYVRPASVSGETADFTVSGGFVSRLKGAAGSSRPGPRVFLFGSSQE